MIVLRFVAIGVILAAVVPTRAGAQGATCAALRDVVPVGEYVKMVLARADAGMQYAAGVGGGEGGESLTPAAGWIRTADRALRGVLDTELRVTAQQRDLTDATACLHIDRVLLHCRMDEVRQQMRSALQAGSWGQVETLTDLLEFLQERERQLVNGALSPRARDTDWAVRRTFDPPGAAFGERVDGVPVCGDGMIGAGEECDDGNTADGDDCSGTCMSNVCPFHSDYADATVFGGCASIVLEEGNRLALPSVAAEHAALVWLEQSLIATQPVDQGEMNQRQPPVAGCMDARGTCEVLPSLPCTEGNDCLVAGGGACVMDDAARMSRTPERHALSADGDPLRVLAAFQQQRRDQGAQRRQRTDLLLPGERRPDGDIVPVEPQTIGQASALPGRRSYYAGVSAQQGAREAVLFALTADPRLSIAAALQPLREATTALAGLTDAREGLRDLVIRFAAFLLRSCTDRPCNVLLQRIIAIAETDACFPYTSGAYLNHTCENPSWKACADAIESGDAGMVEGLLGVMPEPEC
jgi:cysteine-rich repeat protein